MDGVTKVLSREETKRKAVELLEKKLASEYPTMNPAQRRHFAKKYARLALKEFGKHQQMTVTTFPASRWQNFKLKYAPKWFLQRWPVQWIEA